MSRSDKGISGSIADYYQERDYDGPDDEPQFLVDGKPVTLYEFEQHLKEQKSGGHTAISTERARTGGGELAHWGQDAENMFYCYGLGLTEQSLERAGTFEPRWYF